MPQHRDDLAGRGRANVQERANSNFCFHVRRDPNWVLFVQDNDPVQTPPGAILMPPLLTAPDVAAFCRCTLRHVQKLTKRGILRPVRLGRSVRYRRSTLLASIERMEEPGLN
jgi:hypothetical protein